MTYNLTATLVISKGKLLEVIDRALHNYRVAALTTKNKQPIYDYVTSSSDIELIYHPTILPPKKFFFPPKEVIVEYVVGTKIKPKIESEPLLLFGVRPCDLYGIHILDEVFADTYGDPNYLTKRENSVVIGLDCCKICDEHAFCYKVKSNETTFGFDIMLYELPDKYLIQIANAKGKKFVNQYLTTTAINQQDITDYQQKKAMEFGKHKPFKDLDRLPEIFEQNKQHKIWQEEGSRCFSCGSCVMGCPTCYCFDIVDEMELNLKQGKQIRTWDACMLNSFAEVASGENFRKSAAGRVRHRMNRKFNFLMRKYGKSVCTGCGRCVRACLAQISPKTVVEKITGEWEEE